MSYHFDFTSFKRLRDCNYKVGPNRIWLPHEFYDKFFDSCEPYYESKWLTTFYTIIISIVLQAIIYAARRKIRIMLDK